MHHPCPNCQTHRANAGARAPASSQNGFRRREIAARHLPNGAPQERNGGVFCASTKRGFEVELLGTRSAYINGKLCIQRKACRHDIGTSGYKYTYLSIRQPRSRFDICAWKLPDGRFLILPKKLTGFRQTTFNPEESEHQGTASSSHYYRRHIERWSLLGPPRRSK